VSQWYTQIESGLNQLEFAINQSLYEHFGGHYETQRAENSYGELLAELGIRAEASTLAYATTNYDHVGEDSLQRLNFHPDVGYEYSPYGSPEFVLNPRGLARIAGPNRTPVFHLHGSVGWFIREDGTPVCLTQQKTLIDGSSPGTPIAMLPDLNKDYQNFSVIDGLWTEFELILRRAKAIFVLGHSLNDVRLCNTIKNLVPLERIGVGMFVADPEAQSRAMNRLSIKADQTIPMSFGSGLDVVSKDAIKQWRQKLDRLKPKDL
jgi:hypothetical protein